MPQGSHLRRRYYVDEVPGLAIFVRELPLDITADKLGGAFAAFGPVRHVNLKTQKGKDSFAFVTFESTEAASAAIEHPPVIGGVQARTPAAGDRGEWVGARSNVCWLCARVRVPTCTHPARWPSVVGVAETGCAVPA